MSPKRVGGIHLVDVAKQQLYYAHAELVKWSILTEQSGHWLSKGGSAWLLEFLSGLQRHFT